MEQEYGLGWADNVHPDDYDRCLRIYLEAFDGREPFTMEYRLRRFDGAFRWLMDKGVPFYSADGRFAGYLGSCIDITDRKLNEEQMERLVAERTSKLRQSRDELEAFSYTVSHDLRAPLRALQGFGEILSKDYAQLLPPEAQSYLQQIVASSARIDRLIRDVLTYSRIARDEIRMEPTDPEKLIADVLQQNPALQAPAARIRVESPLLKVLAHEPSLVQCLSNLLGNAVKFVKPGITPEVKFWTDARGDRVRLFVRDNGIGIAPEHQDKVFGIFQRLHSEQVYSGSGIGLAIVRKAAERMGGTIRLESRLGQGSTFCLELSAAPKALP